MKSFDLEKIKEVSKSIYFTDESGRRRLLFPAKYLLKCGWDKYDYDNYAKRYQAGILVNDEKLIFEIIYNTVQKILAEIEELAIVMSNGKNIFSPSFAKVLLELYNPIAYSTKTQEHQAQLDKLNKIDEQNKLENEGPIKI